ncbi:MAG TPA: alpha/beta fold hydrolase [Oscillatoriales cyanobacterium M59_W2019_021]|nr:MAG: alpha/beta fold hydrolase [Cyanobacteria bacterium J055]HIK33218.1 alpha/beta fold hydrolase [Oscillatoriales cyanobacterium M4454_W2019_049]HIK49317.1 alpha/beta fold hydrolase [Oscillatoriales cyanobacterium M59_W2019_021]
METTASAAAIAGQYWNWRGHDIYYVRAGEANTLHPPLLLVHGFGASTDHWRKNLEELGNEFQVFAIDLLGFGRSAKPHLQYSGELWRDQLHDFIAEVIGQPAILAGNSLGGYASLCVAAQRPQSAAGLILINSAGPFSDSEPKPEPKPTRKFLSRGLRSLFLQDWVAFLVFQNTRRKSVIRKTLEKVYVDRTAVTDRLVEEIYRPSCDRGAFRVFASIFRTPQGETVDRLLEQLTCPLLMLWGEGDPWINARQRGAKFRQYYPQLTEYYLNAGHCPHDEIPIQVNSLISSWVKSIV